MLLGASAYVAVAPHSTETLIAGAVVAAGAALAPDLDTRSGTLANSFRPITRPLAALTARLFGGHRNGTHSFAFCALAALFSAGVLAQHQLFVALVGWFSLLLAFGKLEYPRRGSQRLVAATALAVAGAVVVKGSWWLPVAVLLGCLSHLLADALTPEGVVPGWPLIRRRVGIGIVRNALIESLVVAAGIALAVAMSCSR